MRTERRLHSPFSLKHVILSFLRAHPLNRTSLPFFRLQLVVPRSDGLFLRIPADPIKHVAQLVIIGLSHISLIAQPLSNMPRLLRRAFYSGESLIMQHRVKCASVLLRSHLLIPKLFRLVLEEASFVVKQRLRAIRLVRIRFAHY